MESNMNDEANSKFEDFEPKMDSMSQKECHTYLLHLPGFKKNQLKVTLLPTGILRVFGKRILENKCLRFEKEISLPDNYDPERVSAKHLNGVLHITCFTKNIQESDHEVPRDSRQSPERKQQSPEKNELKPSEDINDKKVPKPHDAGHVESIPKLHDKNIQEPCEDRNDKSIPEVNENDKNIPEPGEDGKVEKIWERWGGSVRVKCKVLVERVLRYNRRKRVEMMAIGGSVLVVLFGIYLTTYFSST